MSMAVKARAKPRPICGVRRNGESAHSSSSRKVAGKMRRNFREISFTPNETADSRYSRTGIPAAEERIKTTVTHAGQWSSCSITYSAWDSRARDRI